MTAVFNFLSGDRLELWFIIFLGYGDGVHSKLIAEVWEGGKTDFKKVQQNKKHPRLAK